MESGFNDTLTHKIIGCAMKVHSTLGSGFQEIVYQNALEIEMEYEQLAFIREKEMPIYYRERRVGLRRVDFFVENLVMLELKAAIQIEDIHLAQALNYLEAYNVQTGLLINFGSQSLTFKRLYNKKFRLV
jgi:GxxExxY protein